MDPLNGGLISIFTAETRSAQRIYFFCLCTNAESISFAVLSTVMKKYYSLCDLCALSEAGGEFSLIYLLSKACTISLAKD